MPAALIRKLEAHAPLSAEHRRKLEALTSRVHSVGPRENILCEGEEPHVVNVVLSGWAYRYKTLPDGRRQIIALFLPGDMCEPYVFLLNAMDHTVGTLTPVTLAKVPAQAIRLVSASDPELAETLWWQTRNTIEIQREWTVSIGRRSALERMAHLFCEVCTRLSIVGLSNGSGCEMPLTQNDLADAMGLSQVHVNRVLQELRAAGLI